MNAEILIPLIGALAAVAGGVVVHRAARSVERREDRRDPDAVVRQFVATAPKKYIPKTGH